MYDYKEGTLLIVGWDDQGSRFAGAKVIANSLQLIPEKKNKVKMNESAHWSGRLELMTYPSLGAPAAVHLHCDIDRHAMVGPRDAVYTILEPSHKERETIERLMATAETRRTEVREVRRVAVKKNPKVFGPRFTVSAEEPFRPGSGKYQIYEQMKAGKITTVTASVAFAVSLGLSTTLGKRVVDDLCTRGLGSLKGDKITLVGSGHARPRT